MVFTSCPPKWMSSIIHCALGAFVSELTTPNFSLASAVNLVIDNRGVCSNNLVMIKEEIPPHQGKGVTMIYLKRAKRGCIEPRCYMAFLCICSDFFCYLSAPLCTVEPLNSHKPARQYVTTPLVTSLPCLGTGQDGDILAGVAWPDPRFTGYLFSCIVDNLTGLMWSANPIDFSLPRVWSEAVTIPPQINHVDLLTGGFPMSMNFKAS